MLTWFQLRGEKHVELDEEFTKLLRTNVIGNIHLFNSFMPQVLKSKIKKVVTISSGMGDMDFVKDYDISMAPLYAASKSAMNMIAAKFSAQYKERGVLFLSICPGMVDVGHFESGKSHMPTVNYGSQTHPADFFCLLRSDTGAAAWPGKNHGEVQEVLPDLRWPGYPAGVYQGCAVGHQQLQY